MKTYRWIIFGILGCLAVAAIAYFWTSSLMDSMFAYRSPLRDTPPMPGEPLGAPLTRRVVFVLIDALREDTSLKPEIMPFLNELRQQSAWATMHSRPPSYSDPGYTVLMTGAWPDISDGPTLNLEYEETPTWTQDNLFSAAHRAGLRTAVSGYYWFEKLIPQEAVDASFYTPGEDAAADREVVDAALPWLESDEYHFIFIHLDQMDYAGHYEGGPRDPRWDAAARRADDLLREIVSYLDLEQDTVIVLSDHGQIDRGGHGGYETVVLTEPFVLAGAGVKPGHYPDIQMVDVAPTIAALLGTNLPASAQGCVLAGMLATPSEYESRIHGAEVIQKQALLQGYETAIGSQAARRPLADSPASYVAAMDEARTARLARERVWRNVLAVFIAVLPPYILIVRKEKRALWLLGGALLYVLLFNLRYAILEGRTYSLSSVVSQDDLILFNLSTAAIALGVAWLVAALGAGAFRLGARRAAEFALALTFTTLYLLALPTLWSFALNGALVTWTLPDFASMFMAFISLLQSMMVAVVGLVLTGISAAISFGVTRFTPKH